MCKARDNRVIVYVDKTVIKFAGLSIKGLNTKEVEDILTERLGAVVRVIGVTGTSIDMDVYDIPAEDIYRDEEGLIKALALAEGINLTDISELSEAKRIREVDLNEIDKMEGYYCPMQRWREYDNK